MTIVRITTESPSQMAKRERDERRRQAQMSEVRENLTIALIIAVVAAGLVALAWIIAWATTRDDVEQQRTNQTQIKACQSLPDQDKRLFCLAGFDSAG